MKYFTNYNNSIMWLSLTFVYPSRGYMKSLIVKAYNVILLHNTSNIYIKHHFLSFILHNVTRYIPYCIYWDTLRTHTQNDLVHLGLSNTDHVDIDSIMVKGFMTSAPFTQGLRLPVVESSTIGHD